MLSCLNSSTLVKVTEGRLSLSSVWEEEPGRALRPLRSFEGDSFFLWTAEVDEAPTCWLMVCIAGLGSRMSSGFS